MFVFEFKLPEQKLNTVSEKKKKKDSSQESTQPALYVFKVEKKADMQAKQIQEDIFRQNPPSLFNYKEPSVGHVLIG